jgi:hypothetical protein
MNPWMYAVRFDPFKPACAVLTLASTTVVINKVFICDFTIRFPSAVVSSKSSISTVTVMALAFHPSPHALVSHAAARTFVGIVGPRANGSVLNEQERSATRFESQMTSGNVAIQVQARSRWLNNPPNEVQKVNLDGKIGHFGQSFGVAVIARAPARGVFFFDNHAHADAAFGDHAQYRFRAVFAREARNAALSLWLMPRPRDLCGWATASQTPGKMC